MISGPFQAVLSSVITWNPEPHCTCPREESFPLPLKCIGVTRTTDTSLEICQIRGQFSHDSLY